ncbi:MAG: sigma-70 family RNA polymerase sigma factor [Planctomycetota bacterium]|nr:sigma-70 family RNA polymerase sigma factor [Planctomycetota bacterium]
MDHDLTQLLERARAGDVSAASAVFAEAFEQLRSIARRHLAGERLDHTLQATALVNEAFVRMVGQRETGWENHAHFIHSASQAMRRILVDHARARGRAKRGGGQARVRLDDGALPEAPAGLEHLDILALDEALTRLAALDERQARLVELRCFGGMSEEEAAELLGISRRTASIDWSFAKAWLRRELSDDGAADGPGGSIPS